MVSRSLRGRHQHESGIDGSCFCTGLRDQNMFGDSRLSTLIHEVTHFVDTFGSSDPRYGLDPTATAWARANPDLALRNADTLTGFVIYGEDLFAE
ncbi:M35 family metallo-endopeptidase [Burkholderia sp. DN3021]|uniref:M35 family metallo-endopeptidase n=1 Tax=Burkholderia sp. DN3021 TaxID=3410137 RepID=UPI003C7D3EED